MTLGQRLSATLADLTAKKIHEAAARDAAQLEKINKDRAAHMSVVNGAMGHIREKIEAGLVPHYKVTSYDQQNWVRSAVAGRATHQDIWDDMIAWADDQGLTIIKLEEHDGVGINSWIALTVAPVAPAA